MSLPLCVVGVGRCGLGDGPSLLPINGTRECTSGIDMLLLPWFFPWCKCILAKLTGRSLSAFLK